MELKSIKDAFDRVANKQKLSYTKTHEIIHMLSQELDKALSLLHEPPPPPQFDHRLILASLKKTLQQENSPLTQLELTEKELNVALTKYPKILEKQLNPDISKAYRHNAEFDTDVVNQITANFFYRQGMFDIGDSFLAETESECSTRQSFVEMHRIVEALNKRELGLALNWAIENSEKLKQSRSDLEMKLHSLRFLEIARDQSSQEAINYAREHLSVHADNSLHEIQKLSCSLLWSKNLEHSPYSDLLSPSRWNDAAREFTRQYCNLLGESFESALSTTVSAGTQALPVLLKYMNVMAATASKKRDWESMEQLPVAVELSEEFRFHSVFVCPVSKEQASDENPPMMMSCGHVLCKQTINKMSKNGAKSSFKCPYCPTDVDISRCRLLHF